MLELRDRYAIGQYARNLSPDSDGCVWFLGPMNTLNKHDLRERSTQNVCNFPNLSSSFFSEREVVSGSWDGEISRFNYVDLRYKRFFELPNRSSVVSLAVDPETFDVYASTRREIYRIGRDGETHERLQIDMVVDILIRNRQLWVIRNGRIEVFSQVTHERTSISANNDYLVIKQGPQNTIAGFRGDIDFFEEVASEPIGSINGHFNQICSNNQQSILGRANQDGQMHFCKESEAVLRTETYGVSNVDSIAYVASTGFLVSCEGEFFLYR